MTDRKPLPGVRVLPPMPETPGERSPSAPRSSSGRKPRAGGTRASRGRFVAINAFVDSIAAGLTRSQALAWLTLWRDTDARTGLARTAASDIARRIGASRRAVGDAIRHLIEAGLLVQVRRGGLNLGPSVYRVLSERRGKPPAGGEQRVARGKRASR